MQIYIKQAVGACPLKTVFINLYGEKPYMSKRKAACSNFANVALNSYTILYKAAARPVKYTQTA